MCGLKNIAASAVQTEKDPGEVPWGLGGALGVWTREKPLLDATAGQRQKEPSGQTPAPRGRWELQNLPGARCRGDPGPLA